jgi:hypothetical protein
MTLSISAAFWELAFGGFVFSSGPLCSKPAAVPWLVRFSQCGCQHKQHHQPFSVAGNLPIRPAQSSEPQGTT